MEDKILTGWIKDVNPDTGEATKIYPMSHVDSIVLDDGFLGDMVVLVEGDGLSTDPIVDPVVKKYIDNEFDERLKYTNPNLLINGDFQVWQRGESVTCSSTNRTYMMDRWSVATTNATFVKTEVGFKCISSSKVAVSNILEFKLKLGKTYTLSASIDEKIYHRTIVGGNYDVNTENMVLNYSPFSSYDRIVIHVENGQMPNWVKLEQGSLATPLVPRSYGEELFLCQRYYQTIEYYHMYGTAYDTHAQITVLLNEMRARPTATFGTNTVYIAKDGVSITNTEVQTFKKSILIKHRLNTPSTNFTARYLIENMKLDAEIY